MAFCLRFTGLVLARYQKHSIDDSLIKKLYSAEKPKDEEEDKNALLNEVEKADADD